MTEPTYRPRTKCRQCGESHRGKYDTCRACRTRSKADIYPEREIALTGGRWVRRRGILVWDGPVPEETSDSTDDLLDTLAQNLRADAIVNKKPEPAFCACGCWLVSAEEDCPACMARVEWLPWALKAEARHNKENFTHERRAA